MRPTNTKVTPARPSGLGQHLTNASWGMFEYLAYPLLMFITTPLFLVLLGTAQYGQWMLLLTFIGLGGLGGVGMGTATIREVSAARAQSDEAGAIESVRAALLVTILASLTLSFLLLAIGLNLGPSLLAKVGPPSIIRVAVVSAAIIIVLEQVDTVFAGTIRGFERFDLSARIEVVAKFSLILGALVAAYSTGDVRWVFVSTVGFTLLRALGKGLIARHLLGYTPYPRWHKQRARRIFAFGKWTWAQSLGASLFSSIDRLLVGSLLGAGTLAAYSICLQLSQQIHTIPAAGAQFLFPTINRRRESSQRYRGLAIRASLLISIFGATLAICVLLLGPPILKLWVGATIASEAIQPLSILAIAYGLLAANVGPYFVSLGEGGHRYSITVSLISGVIAAAISYPLIIYFGIQGAALSRFAYAVFCLAILLPMLRWVTSTERWVKP